MSFVDKVEVFVLAGDGGDGKLSFRHEKYIAKGGPDGGDGGHGASVVLQASRNQNTLASFRYQKELKAEPGKPGGKSHKHGRSGPDLIVAVPVGTVAINDAGETIADLIVDGQSAIIAKGGRGGFGNAHFVSSRRQAPTFAEKGEAGEHFRLSFELKMIADVGLIGLPNAGKSTLLSRVSNARPEIADYPFTTLRPNLGVVDINDTASILFADIPGLIEGAAEGKGLGHDFLRHIERTAVIVHLIDAYVNDAVVAYKTIRRELGAYNRELLKRPEIIALSKVEGLDEEIVDDLSSQLQAVAAKGTKVLPISARSGQGLSELLQAVQKQVERYRKKSTPAELKLTIPLLQLTDMSNQWSVEKTNDGFLVQGPKIEKFGARTDYRNEAAVERLRDIMRRFGIMHELRRQGIEAGQAVHIGSSGHFTY